MSYSQSDIKIFGKPTTRPCRRMGVALSYDSIGADINKAREKAIEVANKVKVE